MAAISFRAHLMHSLCDRLMRLDVGSEARPWHCGTSRCVWRSRCTYLSTRQCLLTIDGARLCAAVAGSSFQPHFGHPSHVTLSPQGILPLACDGDVNCSSGRDVDGLRKRSWYRFARGSVQHSLSALCMSHVSPLKTICITSILMANWIAHRDTSGR